MKYTESNEFTEKTMKVTGDDIESFLQTKKDYNSKEEKVIEAIKVLKEHYNSEMISKILAYTIISEHRTNQQLIIKNIFNALKFYAEHSGSDARNQQSIDWSKSATEKETYFPFI
jgi:hypothetical protein